MTTPNTYKKLNLTNYNIVSYKESEPEPVNKIHKSSLEQDNTLKQIHNKEYIMNTNYFTVDKRLNIYKLDINKISYNKIYEFSFNNIQQEINININDLLIINTNNDSKFELNFLINILLARACEGFNKNTKLINKNKYGFYFIEPGQYYITRSQEKCRQKNLLIVNVL
jgi:hypothetical protein